MRDRPHIMSASRGIDGFEIADGDANVIYTLKLCKIADGGEGRGSRECNL